MTEAGPTEVGAVSLHEIAEQQLAKARQASSGRATVRIDAGAGELFRHVLLALAKDQSLADHANPGEATVQILSGRMRLEWSTGTWEGSAGDFATIPVERHAVVALEDSTALLTVAHGRHDL